ncbi:CopG family antitoxin [Xanthobacter autotrophicus]
MPIQSPTTGSLCRRPSVSLLERIKVEASTRDVSYQSRIKMWLKEAVG